MNNKDNHKTLAVLQLTRTGDIIQTLHVFKALKLENPDVRLVLIAREKLAKGLSFLIDQVFDKIYYLNCLDWFKGQNSLEKVIERQQQFLNEIESESINVLINLSFSKSSALMARLIKSDHTLGFIANDQGGEVALDNWSQYIASSVMKGPLNGLSIIDLYKFISGAKNGFNQKARPAHENTDKKIVIHPFASHGKKHWKPAKWVEIIYKVLKSNPTNQIHIVGASHEKHLASQICQSPILKDYSDRIFSHLDNQSTIQDTWNLLQNASLFVGHDSMVSHLAAYSNTQSLTISLGTVRPQETAPYGENHYVLTPKTKCFPCFPTDACELYQCHSDISYHTVSTSIEILLNSGEITNDELESNISSFHLNSLDFYQTTFTKGGLLELRSINNHSTPTVKTIFQNITRMAWLYLLEQVEEEHDFAGLSPKTFQGLQHVQSGLSHLFDLCEFGKNYSKKILEEIAKDAVDISTLKKHSEKIDEIDVLSKSLKTAHPIISPIIDYLELQKATLGGDNLVKIAESAYLTYDKGSLLSRIVYDLVDKNCLNYQNKHKTQSVQP